MKTIKELFIKLKKKGLGDIFISSVFSEFISFIVVVFIVRFLSKEDYGYYAIAYNIYGYISVFIGLGLNNGILQYCSEIRPAEQKKSIYSFAKKIGTYFNIVLLFLMPLLSFVLLDGKPSYYFILMAGWPCVAYLSSFYLMRLRVIKDNRHFMLSNVISAIIFLGVAVPFASVVGIIGYIVAIYIKYVASIFLSWKFLKSQDDNRDSIVLDRLLKYEIIKYSLVCCLTNFASQILMLVDVTCVNYFIGEAASVATYKTATQIPVALLFVPSSIIVFAFPYLAENNTNYQWLEKNSKKILAGIFCVNVVVAIIVIVFAPLIVRTLWGERYLDAVDVLRILTVNFVVTGSFNMVFGNIMVAIKKVNVNLVKTVVCSCLNIVLDIILIRMYGSIGAAYATLIVSLCSSSFAILYFVFWIKKQQKHQHA